MGGRERVKPRKEESREAERGIRSQQRVSKLNKNKNKKQTKTKNKQKEKRKKKNQMKTGPRTSFVK